MVLMVSSYYNSGETLNLQGKSSGWFPPKKLDCKREYFSSYEFLVDIVI